METDVNLYHGDCMALLKEIPDRSVDMILCDLPYGVTKNKWDSSLDLGELWKHYKRVIKPNAAIVLFADGMFMANLMMSNPKMWRYNLVWDKVLVTGFLNANRMPLRSHEEICVFYDKPPVYHPQKTLGDKNHSSGVKKSRANNNYGAFDFVDNAELLGSMKHPRSIVKFQKVHASKTVHPTQKPVELCEYLIRTYTEKGDTVLDSCMGSGTTGVACVHTGRKFVGIELDKQYFDIATDRILNAECQLINKTEKVLTNNSN